MRSRNLLQGGVAIALLILVLAWGSQNAMAQQRVERQENTPSLEETLKWIKDKLLKEAIYPTGRGSTYRVDSVNFDGCSIRINDSVTGGSVQTYGSYWAHLADLDPVDVWIYRIGGYNPYKYTINFNTIGKKPKVRTTLKTVVVENDGREVSRTDDDTASVLNLSFPDEEIRNRVARAFVHAIRLCGGSKKEPF